LVRAPRYRGRVRPCPARRTINRPVPRAGRFGPDSLLRFPIPHTRPFGIVVGLPHRNGIDPAHPAVQIDVATAARAEWPIPGERGLAADRAGFAGCKRRAGHGRNISRVAKDGSHSRFAHSDGTALVSADPVTCSGPAGWPASAASRSRSMVFRTLP